MRASRLMTLLLHLQVRGNASGKELAKLLGVGERTVQRDVEALVAAGIPVLRRRRTLRPTNQAPPPGRANRVTNLMNRDS
jgi:predicted DNA-binding transcriptional regulator YafY